MQRQLGAGPQHAADKITDLCFTLFHSFKNTNNHDDLTQPSAVPIIHFMKFNYPRRLSEGSEVELEPGGGGIF